MPSVGSPIAIGSGISGEAVNEEEVGTGREHIRADVVGGTATVLMWKESGSVPAAGIRTGSARLNWSGDVTRKVGACTVVYRTTIVVYREHVSSNHTPGEVAMQLCKTHPARPGSDVA